jgi:putative oxidoreductase
MIMAQDQAKLLYPTLSTFYEGMLPVAATLVRIIVGVMFLMHVSGKFKIGAAAVASNICLIIGLFTRFFAAALAIEMLIALLAVHLAKGYAASAGGYEYVLLIGVVCFTIAIRGGGPYSVDRLIGKEL